ncbi:MAG: bifunctional UDP-N-acetylglucosamine diphosphorylase/glucosamine-1-phosphate N-acetyltransferase GlmU [Nocardioidaceae bacterium]|nr:bifunctional UDP-N-acetylglucosamine diphosphorylase/glucosamine-1-phosphate N-acetyltransferase GlmU [Nocardioidaceae bacterium]
MTSHPPAAVVVLAAGGGTRMRSATPKVLHRIGGRSLVGHVLLAARGTQPDHLCVVVGHGRDEVAPHVTAIDRAAFVAVQAQQLGTAHAVLAGLEALPMVEGTVLVTYGDVPLQTTETLADLMAAHESDGNAVTVLTAQVPDPFGYGRIIRDDTGAVAAIVEEKDATDDQRAVNEINSGIFAYQAAVLRDALGRIGTDNAKGEMYLTDAVAIARADGHRVGAVRTDDGWQTEGVNTRAQLSRLGAELNRRTLSHWMAEGVEVIDPTTTWVDVGVLLAADVSLEPGVQLHGSTQVASGAVIGPDTTLTDVVVGVGARVVRTHGSQAVLGAGSHVGPFAYVRPGTVLGTGGRIGTFVETKNAEIADGAKVPHLSYVGDAEIGTHSNIGAGTIFANYDGLAKHRTSVGAHCRTGANNTFVAPVDIGDGAATGAGTVVRRAVPPGALSVSTGPQRHVEDWVLRKRAGTAAADAAMAATEAAAAAATEEEHS